MIGKAVKLAGDGRGLPPLRLGAGKLAVPGLELRIVPELLDHGHPGGDLARRGDLQGVGRVRSGIVKTNPALPSVSGKRRGRWPGPGCRWPGPPSAPGPAIPARATARAPPGSPGRNRAGRACWPSGAGSSGPRGPPAAGPAPRTCRVPQPPAREYPAARFSSIAIRAKTVIPLDGWGLMNVTYFGSGFSATIRSSGIGSGMTGPSRPSSRAWWRPRVFGGEDHGRRVGEGRAVAVSEIVQMEDHGDPPRPAAAHQLEAGRMTAVGQQHVGPEPVEHLLGQLQENGPLPRIRRPLRPA